MERYTIHCKLKSGYPDPWLLIFMPLCKPLLLSINGTCDFLLTNRIWQRWLCLVGYKEASNDVVVVSCPQERTSWQGTEGISQPTFSKKGRPSDQQPARNWMLPKIKSQKWILPHLCLMWELSLGRHFDCSPAKARPDTWPIGTERL